MALSSSIIKYRKKDGTSSEKWVNGETLLNASNLNALAENLQSIIDWKETNAKRNNWWVNAVKPVYSASEVGADSEGTAARNVQIHNADINAHGGTFARRNHTHYINQIVDFPKPSNEGIQAFVYNGSTDVKKYEFRRLKRFTLTGDYNDMVNAPVVPTKVSELENDASYIKQKDITRTQRGSWNGGTLGTATSPTIFTTGFRPTYIRVLKSNNKTKSSYYIDYRFTYHLVTRLSESGEPTIVEVKVNNLYVNFADWGFTLADISPEVDGSYYYNELNEPGYTYDFVAVGKGTVELPYVTNDNNGDVMYVKNGKWELVNISKVVHEVPSYDENDLNKTLLVSNINGVAELRWKPWHAADGGLF